MKKHIAIGILFVLLMVGFSGCTTTQVPTSSKSAVNINLFASVNEGELIRFYFTLEDINGINTISDGSLTMNIYDDEDTVLYTQQFNVKESEFKDYGYVIALANDTYWAEGRDARVAVDVFEKWDAETQTWVRHPFYA